MDRNLALVPLGAAGELCIGGDGVGEGYINDADLTSRRFLMDPFVENGRLYRTGDLVRWQGGGELEFIGRIDQQVKMRGFRIELGEIECALSQYPGVRECAVLAREDASGASKLVAYVVPRSDRRVDTAELRAFLKRKLPLYMVPATFVLRIAMPLTGSGKIDRKALPAAESERTDPQTVSAGPRNSQEEALVNTWKEVLGIDSAGIHDNFFELGGDSILGIQVIAKANQAGLSLTPKQLFEHQTIAELAAVAGTRRMALADQGIVTGAVPILPYQSWILRHSSPDPDHWNMAIMLEVRQSVDIPLLETAVRHLLVHHDALRMRFDQDASLWSQRNAAPQDEDAAVFSYIDLKELSEDQQTAGFETAAASAQTSLKLSDGPLLRVVYFDRGSAKPGPAIAGHSPSCRRWHFLACPY
jgi:hypothetical protein